MSFIVVRKAAFDSEVKAAAKFWAACEGVMYSGSVCGGGARVCSTIMLEAWSGAWKSVGRLRRERKGLHESGGECVGAREQLEQWSSEELAAD